MGGSNGGGGRLKLISWGVSSHLGVVVALLLCRFLGGDTQSMVAMGDSNGGGGDNEFVRVCRLPLKAGAIAVCCLGFFLPVVLLLVLLVLLVGVKADGILPTGGVIATVAAANSASCFIFSCLANSSAFLALFRMTTDLRTSTTEGFALSPCLGLLSCDSGIVLQLLWLNFISLTDSTQS